MGMASDVLLGGLRTYPTLFGRLRLECGRRCGFKTRVGRGADLTTLIAAGRHDCPRRDEVMAEVLVSAEAQSPIGGERR